MIELKGAIPFAKGGERHVFRHPSHANRVLKVYIKRGSVTGGGLMPQFFRRFVPGYRTFLLRKEGHEILRLIVADLDRPTRLPVAHLLGFIATDLGMASQCEFVHTADGQAAPSWAQRVADGNLDARDWDAMANLGRELIRIGARCSDITVNNIVLGHRSDSGRMSDYEAVLIDGLGDTHLIPIRTWSKRANTQALHRRFERFGRMAGRQWDRVAMVYK